jgi:hypothetical protein
MEFNFILMRLTLLTDSNTPKGVAVGGVVARKKAAEKQPLRVTSRICNAVVDVIFNS